MAGGFYPIFRDQVCIKIYTKEDETMLNDEKEKEVEKSIMVRLPIDMHTEVKIAAAKKKQTLSTYVRRALWVALKSDQYKGLLSITYEPPNPFKRFKSDEPPPLKAPKPAPI